MRTKHRDYCAGDPHADSSQRTELINRAIVGAIAVAWSRYPSEAPLPKLSIVDQELLEQVLGLLDQESVLRISGASVALTHSGYTAVEQTSRSDGRFAEVLQGGALPDEEYSSSSVVLAILRTHFELRCPRNS